MAAIKYIPSNIGLPSLLKVAAYCRVSTNRPDQLTSLASQEHYYEAMIKNHLYWSFAGVYSDIGSGTRVKNRSGFRSMLYACRRGKIDMILVKSAQRFARNTTDGLKVIRMLRNKNIDIYFEQENIHSLFENSEFLLTVMFARAQAERHSKSEDIKWGIKKAFTNPDSKYYQRKCYGYKHDEQGNLIINEHEANIVRLIYQMSGEGASLAQISSELFKQGIPSPRGCAVWSRETLRQIMRNEKYTGTVTLQKTFVENFLTHKQVKNTGQLEQYQVSGNHEPIIGIVKKQVKYRLSIRVNKGYGTSLKRQILSIINTYYCNCNKVVHNVKAMLIEYSEPKTAYVSEYANFKSSCLSYVDTILCWSLAIYAF